MTEPDDRSRVHAMARESLAREEPLAWFEQVYRSADRGDLEVPWFHPRPSADLVNLTRGLEPGRAIVAGCGYGDDAEHLAARGFDVTAFDLSATAIEHCRARFPESPAAYRTADLLQPPGEWTGAFQLVAEVLALQSMPPELQAAGLERLADWVAPGGHLVLCTHGREVGQAADRDAGPPWPLSADELRAVERLGLTIVHLGQLDGGGRLHCLARREPHSSQ